VDLFGFWLETFRGRLGMRRGSRSGVKAKPFWAMENL